MTRPETPGPQIRQATDACRLLRNAANADRESFYSLHLDAQHRVIGVEEVAKGSTTGVEAQPGQVFKSALQTNAVAVIVAHTHPSGDPTPSVEDVQVTRRLVDAGKLLGIKVLDHVVVASEGCTSILEQHSGAFSGTVGELGARGVRRQRKAPGQ